MIRTVGLLAAATLAVGSFILSSQPAAAAVTYICTTKADCKACKDMHPESTCQTAALARPTDGSKVIKFKNPDSGKSAPKN